MASKNALPAEIMAMVLDYTQVPDLMRIARASKRMQEMVYDDTRWVSRLRDMGVWNELEARERTEAAMKRKIEGHAKKDSRGQAGPNGASVLARRRSSAARVDHLIDPGFEQQSVMSPAKETADKVNALTLDVKSGTGRDNQLLSVALQSTLHVLERVRSLRGAARQEYGKVYGALAPYYLDLARGANPSNPRLFQDFRDPLHQARMLAQLRTFAQSDVTPGWHQREGALESMCGVFENAALQEFEQAYSLFDYDGRLRQYAHVVVELNGGSAVIDSYIHNNRLMQRKADLGNSLDCLHHAFPGQANLNPSRDFFQRLSIAVQDQANVIDRVFPPTVDVLMPFLERIGEDVVSPYITPLFDEAHTNGPKESYLKIVSGVYEQSLQFGSSIKPTKGSKEDFKERSQQVLARAFEPHVDLFLQEELDFFNSRAKEEIEKWDKQLSEQEASAESFFMSNINRQAAKRDFLTSFKKVMMAPVNVLPSLSSSKTAVSSDRLTKETPSRSSTPTPLAIDDANASSRRSASPIPSAKEAPSTELEAKAALMNSRLAGINALFSIEIALTLVHVARSSIERASPFVHLGGKLGPEAREQCEAIFLSLLQILGWRHIRPGFDKALDHLTSYSARQASTHNQHEGVQPLVTFLELVNVGDLIQQMVDVFYVQELCATKLTDRDDFLNPATKEKKKFEQMLDERVAAGLNKGIDVLIDEVEFINGSTQNLTDYNPAGTVTTHATKGRKPAARKVDTPTATPPPEVEVGPTDTAQRVVQLVSGHTSMLTGTTDKNLLDIFNQEVGLRLYTSLCKHLKRQRVSQDGAVRLIADMSIYHAYIATLKNKELLRYFRALREVSQIYLVDGKQGKEIAAIIADSDRYQGIFRAEEVYEFAERRADWYAVKPGVERAMYGVGCEIM